MRPLPGDDPKQREPKIERAEKWLGWKPVVDRKEGLKITIEYFKKVIAL
jgi:dTDP-glucose 4,6-dehydratase